MSFYCNTKRVRKPFFDVGQKIFAVWGDEVKEIFIKAWECKICSTYSKYIYRDFDNKFYQEDQLFSTKEEAIDYVNSTLLLTTFPGEEVYVGDRNELKLKKVLEVIIGNPNYYDDGTISRKTFIRTKEGSYLRSTWHSIDKFDKPNYLPIYTNKVKND